VHKAIFQQSQNSREQFHFQNIFRKRFSLSKNGIKVFDHIFPDKLTLKFSGDHSLTPCISRYDCFKHAAGQDIFLLDWRQVLSYDVSFLNSRIVVNSVINLVNKNLPRTALQICMFHFNLQFYDYCS
jgi:hypothetical protein